MSAPTCWNSDSIPIIYENDTFLSCAWEQWTAVGTCVFVMCCCIIILLMLGGGGKKGSIKATMVADRAKESLSYLSHLINKG